MCVCMCVCVCVCVLCVCSEAVDGEALDVLSPHGEVPIMLGEWTAGCTLVGMCWRVTVWQRLAGRQHRVCGVQACPGMDSG